MAMSMHSAFNSLMLTELTLVKKGVSGAYDANNDWDGDTICGDVDECPNDFYNDDDADGTCGCTLADQDNCQDIVDPCPFDAEEDAQKDGI